ncbi:hypothetical protein KY285_008631 [Solanum tuberosum]|nr:hypothetical protein KY285_008631 [Solanum tuberosum]
MHGITEVLEEKLSVACGGCESLSILYIWGCWKLKWLPERMQELKRLTLGDCGEIESFPEGGLSFNLLLLEIWNCKKLVEDRKEWHLQRSNMMAVTKRLNRCNLQSLSELTLPSSLSQLIIYDCPDLQSLPVKGMPSSLSTLHIRDCPLLTPLLEFDKGEYWPEIAHIPTIVIDREWL